MDAKNFSGYRLGKGKIPTGNIATQQEQHFINNNINKQTYGHTASYEVSIQITLCQIIILIINSNS